ncbi:hypothetical protein ACLIA0_03820 [Bacillaceae bacterium W0354]
MAQRPKKNRENRKRQEAVNEKRQLFTDKKRKKEESDRHTRGGF